MHIGDFHIHTTASIDGTISPGQLIQRAKHVGLTCLAVTDHDSIEGAREVEKHAPFPVIIGEEVTTSGGHVIGLFLQERIVPGMSVPDTIAAIKSQGGLAVAPHPFVRLARADALQDQFVKHWNLFDVVEVKNSNNPMIWDCEKALRFANERRIPCLTGSDTHHLCGVGSNRVFLKDVSTPEGFMRSLASATFDAKVHRPTYFAKFVLNQLAFRIKDMYQGKGIERFRDEIALQGS